MEKRLITIISEDRTFQHVVANLLLDAGFGPGVLPGPGSIEVVLDSRPEAVVIETSMAQGLAGTFLVERLRRMDASRNLPIAVCSPDPEFHDTYRDYLQARGCALIGKPFGIEKLLDALNLSLASHLAERLVPASADTVTSRDA